ncbi:MAG TPA: DUF58 domain-containing protein, partial [Terrimesophilobacter sp.]|nr:DUF58 domain-containing protein [Terrimesophilobacter sp.]
MGSRTGFLAESIVAVVRFSRGLRGVVSTAFSRAVSVVTPLGWVLLLVSPLSLVFGYSLGWVELVVAGYVGLLLLLIAIVYLIGSTSFELTLSLT